MKVLLLFITLSHFLFGLSSIDSKLYFSENPITFTPPLIMKNKLTFVPVRAFTEYFDGKITISKKTYTYKVELNNNKFDIKPNNIKFHHNTKPKTFSKKPFIHQTRLYVPLNEFLKLLGYDIEKSNGDFYAFQSNNQTKEKGANISLDYDKGIKYLTAESIYLPISQKTLPIDVKRFNGKTLLKANDILIKLGYSIKFIDNYTLLKKNNITYSFKSGSNNVKIANKENILSKQIDYQPYIKNNGLYVHFPKFLNDLGFDYSLNNNQLVVLKKLNKIQFEEDDSILISKNSRLNISKFHYLNSPSRAFTDFPYTRCPNNQIEQTNKYIKSISFGQHNTTCRMVINLSTNKKVSATKITSSLSEIRFVDQLPTKKKISTPSKVVAAKPKIPISSSGNSLKGKVIIIDPGHGGYDPGAVTKNNDYEKYYTLDISNRIKKRLLSKGAKVVMLRSKDSNPSLYQRVKRINNTKGDLLISVHVNSFIKHSANGTETYYYKASDKKPAYHIQNQLVKSLKLKNNGIKRAKMYVLRNSNIPGVLIEPCFMTNPKEYRLLKTSQFKDKIAIGTVNGVENYFKNI